jgi:hypothetical protein
MCCSIGVRLSWEETGNARKRRMRIKYVRDMGVYLGV